MKTLLLALLAVGTAYAADPVKLTLEDFTDANGGHGLNGYKGPSWDKWQAESLLWLKEIKVLP